MLPNNSRTFPFLASIIAAATILVSCTTASHRQNPDGSWSISTGGNSFSNHKTTDKLFEERATIVCPQGYTVISKAAVKHELGKPGHEGRIICSGEETLTIKPKVVTTPSIDKSTLAKAKKCQEKGGIWLNDSCQIDIDEK